MIWAVHALSEGFYSWHASTLTEISYRDGTVFSPPPDTNAGSVGLNYFFAQLYDQDAGQLALDGFLALYQRMFGDPWERVVHIEPLIPDDLAQPELTLPFEAGKT